MRGFSLADGEIPISPAIAKLKLRTTIKKTDVCMRLLKRFFLSLIGGIKIFYKNNGGNRAAAISFYALFSLMPLMLLLTAAIGFILGKNTGVLDMVIAFVKERLPYLSDRVVSDLKGLSRVWKTLGWVSIVSLFWSAQFVLDGIANALTAIFETEQKFGILRKKIVNFLVVLIALVAVLASVLIAAVAGLLKRVSVRGLEWQALIELIQGATVKVIIPAVVVAVAVTFVYRMFAGSKLNLRYSFYGSVVFTLLWEAAKHLFALYIANFPTYNTLYSSMGALMIFMLWVFFSVALFLFSAAFARTAYEVRNR